MKNSPLYRRLLSVVLALAMTVALLTPTSLARAAEDTAPAREELELTPVDPSTLDSHTLPEVQATYDKEPYSAAEEVRVSIVLEKASTIEAGFELEGIAYDAAAKEYRQGLKSDQDEMVARIGQVLGHDLDVKWNLTLIANIISANVLYGEIDAIKAIDGITDVFVENRYELDDAEKDDPATATSALMTGTNVAWAEGYTGAGSRVAIIDTGIDAEHLSFDAGAFEYALAQNAAEKEMSVDEYVASLNLLTADKIDEVADQLNVSVTGSQAYRNAKVAYGYNYVDRSLRIDHQDTGSNHGSHVTSIAAANKYVPVDGGYGLALDTVGVQGMAPDAQILTMKVFSTSGASDSDYMIAIEDAIILGADSANLSLGSGVAGRTFSDGYERVMNLLVEKGMVVSISAGNAYSWYNTPYNSNMPYGYIYADDVKQDTVGSPGSFPNAFTVASVDNAGQTGMPLKFGDLSVFYTETSGYGNDPISTLSGQDLEYVLLNGPGVDDNAHVGQAGDDFYALGSAVVSGKVAICFRGSSSFFAKANAAVAQGAVAVLIANNTDGSFGMNLTGYNYSAPAVSILQSDGFAIMAQSEKVTTESGLEYYTGSVKISDKMEVSDVDISDGVVSASDFSSWGIPESLIMKPEILAPGGSIYGVNGASALASDNVTTHDQYASFSGTSMAAPQVAGMAAVMGQYIRENDLTTKTGLSARQLINSLLMGTANPVYDSDGEYWSILKVGSGLANVGKAVKATSYILMDEDATMFPDSARDGKVKAELGDDPERNGEYSFGFTIYPMGESKEFKLRTDIFTQWLAGNAGYGMLQDYGTILIGADVTYEINGETYENASTLDADVNQDGVTDEADAQAILDHITGWADEEDPFDANAADVDGDKAITTVDARLILEAAATPTIEITEPTHVTVNIKLNEDDAAFLAYYFGGNFFVEGYTYIEPASNEEGEFLDVEQSIPILGLYGSWSGPAMFDRTSVIDDAYGTGKLPYLANKDINFMTLKKADGSTQTYMVNPYTIEDEYPEGREAINPEDTVASFTYINIRHLGSQFFAVQNEEGKVLYAGSVGGQTYAPYYYVNGGAWQNYGTRKANVNKALSGLGLEAGEKVTIGYYGVPEYYAIQAAKDEGNAPTTPTLTVDQFTELLEAGLIEDGAAIKYTMTVDTEAPAVSAALVDAITGNIYVRAQDDNYIAYVAIMNRSGSQVYYEAVPEQTEKAQALEVPMLLEGLNVPSELTLLVADYAGNEAAFQIKLSGEPVDYGGTMIGFVTSSTTAEPGSGNRAWEIDPENLWYNHSEGTFGGLGVYSQMSVGVRAAEYVDRYVFMAGTDGWLYAAPLDALGEAKRISKYSSVVDTIYDMAYNYKNKSLYALGDDNTIYQIDLLTGALTPAATLALPGVTGSYAEANTMAIDNDGVVYIGTYGSSYTNGKLFKLTLPEPEQEEEQPELPEGVLAGWYFESADELDNWTLVDADGDGANFYYNPGTGYNDSTGVLQSKWHTPSPDNWAITPAVDLTDATSAQLSFYARCSSSTWKEHFAAYVGTTPDIEAMTEIVPETEAVPNWTQYTFDLTEYLGQEEVYLAIRHFNSLDQYYLYVDNFEVQGERQAEEPGPEEPEETPVVTATAVGSLAVYNYNNAGALAFDHDTETLYLAANYNSSQDYDHYLWKISTKNGSATRANMNFGTGSGSDNPSGRLYGAVNGLFIVPGGAHVIEPTDTAIDITVEPAELNLLKGQSADLVAAVAPWTLTNTDVTFETADPAIATVSEKGTVTGVAVGETVITVTTDAEPHLTAEVPVTVSEPPVAELRGVIWNENGKGMASVFSTDNTANWEALAEVGQLRWAARVDDVLYGSTNDTMFAVDADTYEVTQLGGIVSDWILSDGDALPQDFRDAFAEMGYNVGPVIGPCYGGTYLTMIDPEAGSLIYFDLSDTLFGEDHMATFTAAGRAEYDDGEDYDENGGLFYCITESGELYSFVMNHEGSVTWTDLGSTGLDLTGVADVTNSVWASMVYDFENEFLYLSHYSGEGDYAYLYAIDVNDPARVGVTGDFRADVWPAVGLYEYTPSTDLSLKVSPESIEVYEGATAELKIKVKLGETNEYTVEVDDPTIASFEDGIVTGLKEGETTIQVTTVDVNEAGDHLSVIVPVTVKAVHGVDIQIVGQVTDGNGARFATIDLNDATVASTGAAAPGNVDSGARIGDLYFAGQGTTYKILDAEDFTVTTEWTGGPASNYYSQYPAMDAANYPQFEADDGTIDDSRMLFTVALDWLVMPSYSGWNLSSFLEGLAGVCYAGTDTADDGTQLGVYYLLTTDGTLYYIGIDYVGGRRTDPQEVLSTGITLQNQTDASMAFFEDEVNAGIVVADNGTKNLWYIDFYTGEVSMVGTLDVTNVSGLIGTYDDVAAYGEITPPEPEPVVTGHLIKGFYFEEEPTDWTFVDADEDGFNWQWHFNTGTGNHTAYEGDGIITSASYDNDSGTALHPDNWAISPAIDLSDAEDDVIVSLYAVGQDASWAAEHFAVYAGTSADPDDMVVVIPEKVTSGEYAQFTGSLADFAGEDEVYIAIRHFNVTDMFYLNVDQVEFIDQLEEVTPPEPPTPEPGVTGDPIFTEDFEVQPSSWTIVDADGDDYNWEWVNAESFEDGQDPAYSGEGLVMSASYVNYVGALNPDNWLISPAIDLSTASADAIVSLYAKGQDPDWAAEKFAIYAGTSNDPDEMQQISSQFTVTGDWMQYTASLEDFVGESTVYVAVRHYGVTDMFYLDVDMFQILHNLTEDGNARKDVSDKVYAAPVPANNAQSSLRKIVETNAKLPAFHKALGDGIGRLDKAINNNVEMSKLGETANEVTGGTNAIHGESVLSARPAKPVRGAEGTAEDGVVTVTLTEDVDVTNGLIAVEYDPELLTFIGGESIFAHCSWNAEDGVVYFAYADAIPLPAGEVIATIEFSYTEPALETELTVTTIERNDDVNVDEEPTVIKIGASVIVNGVTLALDGRLAMNMFITAPTSAATATMTFHGQNEDEVTFELIRDKDHFYNSKTGQFRLSYKNIAAKEMTCPVDLKVFDANGNQMALVRANGDPVDGNVFTFRVADWANAIIGNENSNEASVNLAKALLNYGGAAQEYFEFNLEDPANPEGYLADETAAVVANPALDGDIPEDAKALFGYSGLTLNLEGDTELRIYFTKDVTAVDDAGIKLPLKTQGKKKYISVPNIASVDLDELYPITISLDGQERVFTLAALTYANKILAASTNEKLVTVMKALYVYNELAEIYFNKVD